jgi:hypothetical protein
MRTHACFDEVRRSLQWKFQMLRFITVDVADISEYFRILSLAQIVRPSGCSVNPLYTAECGGSDREGGSGSLSGET